jgi:hypothetical protein
MANAKLRVGVLLDDWVVPAWAATMLRQLCAGDYAEICLVVSRESPFGETQERKSIWSRIKANRNRLVELAVRRALTSMYYKLVDRAPVLPRADAPESIHDLLRDIPNVRVRPRQTKWSDYIGDEDVATIRGYQLDVLLRLGFRILRGQILQAATNGVWSYHHGDNRVNRGGPPGFWESMESWPETGTVLLVLSEDLDSGRVLYRSSSSTDTMSVTDNRSAIYWKSASFLPRCLRDLHRLGPSKFYSKIDQLNPAIEIYSRQLYKVPTTREYAQLVSAKIFEKAKLRVRNFWTFAQWQLLYEVRASYSSSIWRYRRLVPPKDRFWADPHAVRIGDRHYVFIEEYVFAKKRGHIAMLEFDARGELLSTEPRTVLTRPYHLSYPFIFHHDNAWYMIPETAERKTVELYRARKFPDDWQLVAILLEGVQAYDATLIEHDGRWWMFASVTETDGASSTDELFVFFADSPLSTNWTPHPLNPVVSDCKSARPAGRIERIGGELIRPSQNGLYRYGYGLNFAKIDVLTTDDYREHIISTVAPTWSNDVVGIHSYTRAGDLHVVDTQVRVSH